MDNNYEQRAIPSDLELYISLVYILLFILVYPRDQADTLALVVNM